MKEKTIDLHMHSTASDGTFTPEEIVCEARRVGLSAIALTDHDCVRGVADVQIAAQDCGLEVVPGVELSAYDGQELHILGYFIQPDHPSLGVFLERMQETRLERVRAMVRKLSGNGFDISCTEVEALAQHMVSRVHIAKVLVSKGYAGSIGAAFDTLIGEGKPYFVERARITPAEAIGAIHEAGGLAVLAHPYLLHCDDTLEELLCCLPELDGLECSYPRHSRKQLDAYRALARKMGLLETGGSDFHGKNRPEAKMGIGCGGAKIPYQLLETMKQRVNKG